MKRQEYKFSINRFNSDDFSAFSSVDVAIWDLKGKILNLPVYSLLGGKQKKIKAYGTYQPRHHDPEGYVEESEEIKSIHWTGVEFNNGDVLDLTGVISQEDVEKVHVAR